LALSMGIDTLYKLSKLGEILLGWNLRKIDVKVKFPYFGKIWPKLRHLNIPLCQNGMLTYVFIGFNYGDR